MPLLYVFELLLLVAVVAGSFFTSWELPAAKDENQR